MDWLDLLAVQGTLKSLLQPHSSKASILSCSAFFIVQLSHPCMTTGKTIFLTRRTFVSKVMSPLFNILSLSCFKIFSCFSHPYGKGSSPTCLCNLASATLGLSCFLLVAPPALSLTSTPASPTHSSLPWSRTVFLPGPSSLLLLQARPGKFPRATGSWNI